jgi:glucose/arabinose dehydrogenase
VTPVAAAGTAVSVFAAGLDHPRWLHVLPNGDVLVAESNAPPRPEDQRGIKGWVMAGNALPAPFGEGMFIDQHGSWNRPPRSGYNVVLVPFRGDRPSGHPVEVLIGFVSRDGEAYGRPVGVALDTRGALLVADDVGNAIWRVTAAPTAR